MTSEIKPAVAHEPASQEATAGKPAGADLNGFRSLVAPFFKSHCLQCHGTTKREGDLTLHTINADVPQGSDIETWKLVAERLALDEMPPEGQSRPDAKTVVAVLNWIKTELVKAGEDVAEVGRKLHLPGHGNRINHAALFATDPSAPTASPSRLWRLSPQIYISFVPRVAGKGHTVGQPFSSSPGEGFKDYAGLFVVDEPTISQLMRNASQIVDVQCGLIRFNKGVKEFQALIKSEQPATDDEVEAAIRRQFQLALLRAPRRDELSRFTALMRKNMDDAGQSIGARATLAAVLLLPEALYRFELGQDQPAADGRRMLGPREIAYAISFALNDEPPDAALLKAVEANKLSTREDVQREVERILVEKKYAKPRIMRFFDEYFEYPAAIDVFKDVSRGQWRPEVLVSDTRLLIASILDKDRNVLKELLTTNKSFVNYRIDSQKGTAIPAREVKKKEPPKVDPKTGQAKPQPPRQLETHDHYNLPEDWQWTAEQPLALPADERCGILTQPSWLAAFATNNENHAIRRGKWIRERLLGGVVPDLPISVDAQLPDAPEKTMRERMHVTQAEYCWQCHRKMNPIGLTFEHYDYLGRYRVAETVLDPAATAKNLDKKGKPLGNVLRDVPIDAHGQLENTGDAILDGEVVGAVPLMHRLADSPRVRQVFVRHAFRYWMGRNETLADGPTLARADQAYVSSGGSMRALIASLLTSDSFLYRTSTAGRP